MKSGIHDVESNNLWTLIYAQLPTNILLLVLFWDPSWGFLTHIKCYNIHIHDTYSTAVYTAVVHLVLRLYMYGRTTTEYYRVWYELKTPTHASHPRGARACEIHFLQILYRTMQRTSHHSGGPRNLDKLVITVVDAPAARSHASACFYRTRKTQRVWDLCNVFTIVVCTWVTDTKINISTTGKGHQEGDLRRRITLTLTNFNFRTWLFAELVENRRGSLSIPFSGPGDNFSKSYDENQIWSKRVHARAGLMRRSEVPYSCHTNLFSS
jgi:hypothetical protein